MAFGSCAKNPDRFATFLEFCDEKNQKEKIAYFILFKKKKKEKAH